MTLGKLHSLLGRLLTEGADLESPVWVGASSPAVPVETVELHHFDRQVVVLREHPASKKVR